MMMSQMYVMIAILVLIVLGAVLFFTRKNKKREKFTPLAGVAFAFVIAGIAFGDNRQLGYVFMGIGVVLAVIDLVFKERLKRSGKVSKKKTKKKK